MNIVIISEYTSRELYVVEQVIKKYPSAVVVQPTYQSSQETPKPSIKRFIKELPGRISWKLHRELWNRRLYPTKKYPEIPNKVFIPSDELNEEAGIQKIKKLGPDVLITCRAPILKPGVINIPKIAAVNVHYGLAPHYRGNDTLFWPLHYKDYKRLGGSIHHLTEGIDTGNIIAEVYPELNPKDGEISIDIKTTKLLSEALLLFLEAAEQSNVDISGKQQEIKGRNFNSKDRTLPISLKYLVKRSFGLARPPHRKKKVITHF